MRRAPPILAAALALAFAGCGDKETFGDRQAFPHGERLEIEGARTDVLRFCGRGSRSTATGPDRQVGEQALSILIRRFRQNPDGAFRPHDRGPEMRMRAVMEAVATATAKGGCPAVARRARQALREAR